MSNKQSFSEWYESQDDKLLYTLSGRALAASVWYHKQAEITNQMLEIIDLKAELAVLKKQLERSQQVNTQLTELQND